VSSAANVLSDGSNTSDVAPPALCIRGLHTGFRARGLTVPAVRGVDLDLHAGEVTVLLGESGSGKSVTAKSVLRLYGPSATISGEVELEGSNLLDLDGPQMRAIRGASVALVPQDPTGSLDPLRRIGSQIIEVLRQHRIAPTRSAARSRALELLAEVGIPDPDRVARSFPHELSGGMRQRAVIAIAVACRPQVLIADEPTTALDVTVQAQILDLFRTLVRELDVALLLVTHDVGVAEEMGDRIGVMYAGKIVEYGAAAEVLRTPMHPYTRALLESIPRPGVSRGGLLSIVGQPPISGELPPGCPFAPRCSSALDRCHEEEPQLVALGATRSASCHLSASEVSR